MICVVLWGSRVQERCFSASLCMHGTPLISNAACLTVPHFGHSTVEPLHGKQLRREQFLKMRKGICRIA